MSAPPLVSKKDKLKATIRAVRATAWRHLKRAFSWDLKKVHIEPEEQALLVKHGTAGPTLQCYLAWRRSVLLVLCAPICLLPVLSTIDYLVDDNSMLTGLGRWWLALQILAPFAMPATAVAALLLWSKQRNSWRLLLWGWCISFLVPLALLLVPIHWLLRMEDLDPAEEQITQMMARVFVGLAFCMALIVLLPITLVSIAFGVQRACLRLKTLVPKSSVPGLFLVASAPVLPFTLMPFFVLLAQAASSPLLLGGFIMVMIAPVVFLVKAKFLIAPFSGLRDMIILRRLQWLAKGTFLAGLLLLLLYALTKPIPIPTLPGEEGPDVQEKTLLGFSEATSLARPWSWSVLRWLLVEVFGRSLFTTVLVADLFMRLNTILWTTHSRQTAASPAQEDELTNI